MKLLSTFLLAAGVMMLTACSTKNSSYSKKGKPTSERTVKASGSKSATGASLSASSYSCEMNQDHRRISIEPVSSGGCQVSYQKADSTQTIAEAKNDLSYCGQVKDKVIQNLQQAGFQCQSQIADSDSDRSLE